MTDRADGFPDEGAPTVAKPCVECPWRRDAMPGWLGPYDAAKWLAIAHGEGAIACHRTIKTSGSWDGASQCRGAATFRANVSKLPRHPGIATGPADEDVVFASDAEFRAHHHRTAR